MSGCSGFFFYPMKELVRTPEDLDLRYQDVNVKTEDGVQIHGWLLQADKPKGIVFFLHGNAENISTHIGSVYWLPEQGYDVLLMDYRGYGLSQGKPDFPQVFQDVDAMYRWLQNYCKQHQIPSYVLAQSLGATISSYYFSQLAMEDRIFEGVVLDSTFSGHQDIARYVLNRNMITWPFQFIVPHFLPTEFNPKDHIAQLSPTPLLMMHSPDDAVLPYEQGKLVYNQAKAPKYWINNQGPHIATFNFPQYRQVLLEFLANPQQQPNLPATNHARMD